MVHATSGPSLSLDPISGSRYGSGSARMRGLRRTQGRRRRRSDTSTVNAASGLLHGRTLHAVARSPNPPSGWILSTFLHKRERERDTGWATIEATHNPLGCTPEWQTLALHLRVSPACNFSHLTSAFSPRWLLFFQGERGGRRKGRTTREGVGFSPMPGRVCVWETLFLFSSEPPPTPPDPSPPPSILCRSPLFPFRQLLDRSRVCVDVHGGGEEGWPPSQRQVMRSWFRHQRSERASDRGPCRRTN